MEFRAEAEGGDALRRTGIFSDDAKAVSGGIVLDGSYLPLSIPIVGFHRVEVGCDDGSSVLHRCHGFLALRRDDVLHLAC